MQLFLLGLNHKTAPVEVREQLSLSASQLSRALRAVRESAGAREAAILSTCNRAEIYALGDDNSAPRLEAFLADFHQVSPNNFSGHLYRTAGGESARHLFRVACGVDSLVLGESQILGQVKSALEAAQNNGAIGGVLDELFRRAISCGKRARAETGIGRGALSVGAAAVELAKQIFGSLAGHTILILGAGKMSELTAQHLVASGAKSVIVANRTHQRAQELAQIFSAETARGQVATRAVTWDEFPEELKRADIVISSTRAPGFVLHAAEVAAAMKARRSRPLLLIDIAVPRDIDPQAHQLDNVYLYDIDDLQGVVDLNRAQRGGELTRVEEIVESEVESWNGWYRGLSAQPVMAALSRRAQSVREREVENALAMLPNLSEREREIVRQMGRSIAGKLMHAPLRHLRQAGENGSGDVGALRRAFALDDESLASTRDAKALSCHGTPPQIASTREAENDAPDDSKSPAPTNEAAHETYSDNAENFAPQNTSPRIKKNGAPASATEESASTRAATEQRFGGENS